MSTRSSPGRAVEPDVRLPASSRSAGRPEIDEEAATVAATRGHLATLGPATAADLARRARAARERRRAGASPGSRPRASRCAAASIRSATRAIGDVEFCERRLLARIHRYTTDRLRREIEPVTAQDFMRFLLRWQHVAPGTQMEGRRGLLAVIEQLQGFEVAAGSWEEAVLPARVAGYRPEWLDDLCLSGEVVWGRFALRAANGAGDAAGRGDGRPRRRGAVARHAGDLRAPRQPGLAAARGARPRAAGACPATARRATSSRRCARAGRCSTTTSSPSPGASASRWRRGSGTWSRAASSPPTASAACARS